MNQGISTLQGPHHVAQKFNRTTLPFCSASFTGAPVESVKLKSGAGFDTRLLPSPLPSAGSTVAAWREREQDETARTAAKAPSAVQRDTESITGCLLSD